MAKTSSSMKRAEEDRPKGVDMAPSQWLDKIVHENQKYYGSFNNEQFVWLDFLFRVDDMQTSGEIGQSQEEKLDGMLSF